MIVGITISSTRGLISDRTFSQGARSMGRGVVEANEQAFHIWELLGFEVVEKQPAKRFGNLEQVVIVTRRQLPLITFSKQGLET